MSLFDSRTYENLLASTLARVPDSFDKRESSIIYNGVAPTTAELAQLYIGMDFVFKATYLLTAPREYLILRAKDRGMEPKSASAAVFRAVFNIEVPIGSRFSCEDINFVVSERMAEEDTEELLSYKVFSETVGSAVNDYTGSLIPIEYIDGLTTASLVELLIPGDDEEDTEMFRQRVLDSIQTQPFGGNQADYKQKVLSIEGVSAVKVYPVWNSDVAPSQFVPSESVQNWFEGGMNGVSDSAVIDWITAIYNAALNKKLSVGGTVKLVIMGANNSSPSDELIDIVQTTIDPTQNTGEGLGLAPIGHIVKVEGVKPTLIYVNAIIEYTEGWSIDNARSYIEAAIDEYFSELAQEWEDVDKIVVRLSHLESKILQKCSVMITDITGTAFNGVCSNVYLDADCIPVRGGFNE